MKESKEKKRKIHLELLRQMATLATSGFGFVAALAWNNLIQELVNSYIKKNLPENFGIISLFLYAVIVTSIAVFITLWISRLIEKLE
jgi:cytochrome b subunit of formate dehydrogenase